MVPTIFGSFVKSIGPGCKPWITKAPSNMASMTLPGIPSATSGTSAPPTVALLADSDAMIPSSHPVPNFSGCLEVAREVD